MTEWPILEVMPLGIVVIDRSNYVIAWNRWMEMYSGIDAKEIKDRNLFDFFPDLDRANFLRACRAVFTFGNVIYLSQKLHHYLFPFPVYGGQEAASIDMMQQSCSMTPIREGDEIVSIAITVQDVTDSVILERRLRQMNQIDGLTGAYNRRYFDKRLEEEVARHRRYERELSLIMMDIDHFKHTNDTHGHVVGDEVLRKVVESAGDVLRASDTLCRYGGEEFVIILPETELSDAQMIAERMRQALEKKTFQGNEPFQVTASFGVASMLTPVLDTERIVKAADQELYRAKESGRNRVCSISGR